MRLQRWSREVKVRRGEFSANFRGHVKTTNERAWRGSNARDGGAA